MEWVSDYNMQDGRPIMPKAGKEHGVGSCKRCGDACGCAGGVKAGACGAGCQAGGCQCAHRVDPDPEVNTCHPRLVSAVSARKQLPWTAALLLLTMSPEEL